MRLHHVQVACPLGGEDVARRFYTEGLGLPEVAKPDELAGRGGAWFRWLDGAEIHVGVEEPFVPARKAHPALLLDRVADLEGHRRPPRAPRLRGRLAPARHLPRPRQVPYLRRPRESGGAIGRCCWITCWHDPRRRHACVPHRFRASVAGSTTPSGRSTRSRCASALEAAMGALAGMTIPSGRRWIPNGMDISYTAKVVSEITCIAETDAAQWAGDDPDLQSASAASATTGSWSSRA